MPRKTKTVARVPEGATEYLNQTVIGPMTQSGNLLSERVFAAPIT